MRNNTRVKVIGLGGVGSIVARYGAVFLAAQRRNTWMCLIDGDAFEPSNASRMIFGRHGNKAQVIRKELLPRFKDSRLGLIAVDEYVRPDNIKRLIQHGDIVMMCVDNHKTRKLVSDYCAKLNTVVLISGGNDGVVKEKGKVKRRGTYGNVQLFVRSKNQSLGPTIDQYHPEIKEPKDKHPEELNCTELVVSTPQILFANLAVASAMLNTLLLHLSRVDHYAELCFDIADGLMRPTLPLKG